MNEATGGASAAAAWSQAQDAIALFALDPHGLGGILVRARPGPVRERWLAALALAFPANNRKLPSHVSEGRLIGGLDLAATLASGRPVAERGLLAQAHEGIVTAAMAERMSATVAALLGQALDHGEVVLAREGFSGRLATRIGVVALDESANDDEHVPAALSDRLAFHLDLDAIATGDALPPLLDAQELKAARLRLGAVQVQDAVIEALCAAAMALGVDSPRGSILALHAARCAAALDGRTEVDASDADLAARLVLAPRATRIPTPPDAQQEPQPPEPETDAQSDPPEAPPDTQSEPGSDDKQAPGADADIDEMVLAAATAAIPHGLLALLGDAARRSTGRGASGRTGAYRKSGTRGRPIGVAAGDPRRGARLSVIETLRAAVPWQRLRRRQAAASGHAQRVLVRPQDFRVLRYRERSETATIFVVDASGSAAIHRLAEAKGAVELLLADCYVRRDRVALIAFRGSTAETLLPPTRSLVRAKRSLGGLPGGGATPLAAGIDAALALAGAARRRGETPTVVLLTDGRANIARDGTPGRARAEADALAAARAFRSTGCATLLLDISPRAQPQAQALAATMGALYVAMPYADARGMSGAVRAFLPKSAA